MIFVTDVLHEEIRAISLDGSTRDASALFFADHDSKRSDPRGPATIRRTDGESYLLKDDRRRRLTQTRLSPRTTETDDLFQPSSDQSATDGLRVERIYDAVLLGDAVLAFADVYKVTEDVWVSSFVYLSDEGPSVQLLGNPIDIEADQRVVYTRTEARYIAKIGTTGYVLLMTGEPKIGVFRDSMENIRPLQTFPEQFGYVPLLQRDKKLAEEKQNVRQMVFIEQQIEQARMPVGLHVSAESLYLLAKEPMHPVSKETMWQLLQLSTKDGSVVSRAVLPTTAAHLIVIPGDTFWAFIEQEEIVGLDVKIDGKERFVPYRPIATMLLVPSAWVERPDGRLDGSVDVVCLTSTS